MSSIPDDKLEEFINDYLKEDLKILDTYINKYNEEISEYVQLKNTLETIVDNDIDNLKTQMDIGSNIFMEAKVDSTQTIFLDVGKGCYLEMNLAEALKFMESKIKILNKESDVLRSESVKKRAAIKLALMCMKERNVLQFKENDLP